MKIITAKPQLRLSWRCIPCLLITSKASHVRSAQDPQRGRVSALPRALGTEGQARSLRFPLSRHLSPITSQGTIGPWEHTNCKQNGGLRPSWFPWLKHEASSPTPKGWEFHPSSGHIPGRVWVGGDGCFSLLFLSQNETNKPILRWGLNNNMRLKGRRAPPAGGGELWPLSRCRDWWGERLGMDYFNDLPSSDYECLMLRLDVRPWVPALAIWALDSLS